MKEIKEEFDILLNSVKKYIELESLFGIKNINSVSNPPSPGDYNKKEKLEHLRKEVSGCSNCALSQTRRNLVFGQGNAQAQLVFVGEAPGMEEDLQGFPFVGAAGKLLTKIIEAMGLKREEVYIANVLKCRPPANRSPLPEEVAQCHGIVWEQLRIINPKVICALGKFAAQTLLNSQDSISNLRGKFFEVQSIKVMPTFHPAYLLRNPADKKIVWEDMKKIRDYLNRNS